MTALAQNVFSGTKTSKRKKKKCSKKHLFCFSDTLLYQMDTELVFHSHIKACPNQILFCLCSKQTCFHFCLMDFRILVAFSTFDYNDMLVAS